MEAVAGNIFCSWFDKLTTKGRYVAVFSFAVCLKRKGGLNS